MTRTTKIALVVGALAVAVVAFLIIRPGDEDESQGSAASPSAQTEAGGGTETDAKAPSGPKVTRIAIKDNSVVGGPKTIEVTKGDTVRIVVTSDAPDEIHLHGYDIEREVSPGHPGRFEFKADAEGVFEMESHTAEDAGLDPRVARVIVAPA